MPVSVKDVGCWNGWPKKITLNAWKDLLTYLSNPMPNQNTQEEWEKEVRKSLREVLAPSEELYLPEDGDFGGKPYNYYEEEFVKPMMSIISSVLASHTTKLVEDIEGMGKEEIIIEDCENCGNEGYGKAWYGKGAENDPHGWGDRYHPTGSVVFCKECGNDFEIGKDWNGEEIWKRTSDLPEHNELRISHLKKKVKENVGYNQALSDIKSLITKHPPSFGKVKANNNEPIK